MSNGAGNKSFNSDIPESAWHRTFDGERYHLYENDREVLPHECEYCGRRMKYADQRCACTALRPGVH